MKPSRRITAITASLVVALLGISALLVRSLDRIRPQATLQELLYISSPKAVKRMSLGYTGLAADIYWTRAVQYFGEKHHKAATSYALLYPLLDITTDLDPKLTVAYEFGANFLSPAPPNGAGLPDDAVKLVEKGIKANPDNWRLYYSLGFVQYLERKDYVAAAKAFEDGSHTPDAHPFLKVLAGKMAQRAGDIETARIVWTAAYETTQDKMIKENAAQHLIALQVEEDVTGLEKTIDYYRDKTGRFPADFRELVNAGMLPAIPLDPYHIPYVLKSDGHVEVRHPGKFSFLRKGWPPDYKPGFSARLDVQ